MNVLTQLIPQFMGQTLLVDASAAKRRPRSTTGGAQGFIDSGDDAGDLHCRCLASKEIPSNRPTYAFNKLSLPQLLEQLLKVRQLNSLSFRNIYQRDWPPFTVFGEINHRHHGIKTLRRKSHDIYP